MPFATTRGRGRWWQCYNAGLHNAIIKAWIFISVMMTFDRGLYVWLRNVFSNFSWKQKHCQMFISSHQPLASPPIFHLNASCMVTLKITLKTTFKKSANIIFMVTWLTASWQLQSLLNIKIFKVAKDYALRFMFFKKADEECTGFSAPGPYQLNGCQDPAWVNN